MEVGQVRSDTQDAAPRRQALNVSTLTPNQISMR